MGRGQVVAKWLFNNNPLPALAVVRTVCFMNQPRLMQLLDGRTELTWHSGEIKQQVLAQRPAAKGTEFLFKRLKACFFGQIALAVEDVFSEFSPDLIINRFGT